MRLGALILGLLVLAALGRELACTAPGTMRMEAAPTALGSATVTALGGLRSVPLMALWSELEEARWRGDSARQALLFDAMEELCPNNAALAAWHAFDEAVGMSAGRERDEALLWLRRSLARLQLARRRIPDSALLPEALWNIGFYAGRRFPLEFALKMFDADEQGSQVKALLRQMHADPELCAYLDREDREQGRAELTDAQRTWLDQAERLRWLAMDRVAQDALKAKRHRSATQATKALHGLYVLNALLGADRDQGGEELTLVLRALRLRAESLVQAEALRLHQAAQPENARSFAGVAKGYLEDWATSVRRPENP